MRHPSVQTEILASLVLLMGLATLLLFTLATVEHERQLRLLVGHALLLESRSPGVPGGVDPDAAWWHVGPDGRVEPFGPRAGTPDPQTLALAEEARRTGGALISTGAVWQPIRFATPDPRGGVQVARLSAPLSRSLRGAPLAVLAAIGLGHVIVFTAVGALFLRRRVVRPVQQLAEAARRIGSEGPGLRVPVEAPLEVAELADAFNEMSAALEERRGALEKAVVDLRSANRELRDTQQGLARAERLAVVGRFAAGVAHEVGNPIGAILAFAELASRDPGISEQSREHLRKIGREGERVGRILRQLLESSKPAAHEPGAFSLARVAADVRELVATQRSYAHASFTIRCDDATPEAWADPSLTRQILLNLLINAGEATRGVPEARVELSVGPHAGGRRSDDGEVDAGQRQPDGVVCVVADSGAGVAPEDRERIFHPFFTTRAPGEGTGLGLSVAQRLAEEMDGALELVPPPAGFRTAFRLRLPLRPRAESALVRVASGPQGVA